MSLGKKSEYIHPGNFRYSRLSNAWKSMVFRNSGKLNFFPRRYSIDPSSVCNLRCDYCFHSQYNPDKHIKPQILKYGDFCKILEKIWKYAMMIEFYNWGEPLLNPELPRMISDSTGKGIRSRISTNLSVPLSDEYAESLVNSGLFRLTAAVDGHTQGIYEKYRKGGNLELVAENARKLVFFKKKKGSYAPILSFRMLVFEWNAEFISETRKFAAELGFDEFHAHGGSYVFSGKKMRWDVKRFRWIELNSKFKDYMPEKALKPCSWLFSALLIGADGKCMPCCNSADQEAEHLSIFEHSLEEIWNSEEYMASRAFTLRISDNRSEVLPVCKKCRLL
jgi:MoaA/NifB/PqqE/SkfB family radical SAM enzyme